MRLPQCDQTWPETLKNENNLKRRLDSIVGFSELFCYAATTFSTYLLNKVGQCSRGFHTSRT